MKRNYKTRSMIALAMAALTLMTYQLGTVTGWRKLHADVSAQTTGLTLPNTRIYALNNDNTLFVLAPGALSFSRLVRVTQVDGNLIGLDFRPADGNPNAVYGLTDTGKLYQITLSGAQLGAATLVSTMSPRFAGGVQSLADFNPVVNALRLIGSNDQNYAVVNANGGNLNTTAVQTAMAYDPGDVNKGVDPNITGGSYTNNFAGAASTLFYAVDYDLDTLVTISSKSATGSSNTGGGQLQTIGNIVDGGGNSIKISPTADLDIYTDANGVNTLIGVSGRTMFTIALSQINQNLQLGTTQRVVAQTMTLAEPGGGYIDVAAVPFFAGATPTPTPTPTPAGALALSYSGTLRAGGNMYFPTFTSSGVISATLQSSAGTNFRFLLISIDRNVVVATGAPAGSRKTLSFTGAAGRYALYIDNAPTGGAYTVTGTASR